MRIPGLAVKIDEAAVAWRATRHPGIAWVPLHADGAGAPSADAADSTADAADSTADAADSTVLIRMAPGRGYPAHRHVGVEEVLVLRGGYRDELGEHRAGDYLRYPAGSVHTPVALGTSTRAEGPDNEACLLFASARGGVANLDARNARGGGRQARANPRADGGPAAE